MWHWKNVNVTILTFNAQRQWWILEYPPLYSMGTTRDVALFLFFDYLKMYEKCHGGRLSLLHCIAVYALAYECTLSVVLFSLKHKIWSSWFECRLQGALVSIIVYLQHSTCENSINYTYILGKFHLPFRGPTILIHIFSFSMKLFTQICIHYTVYI